MLLHQRRQNLSFSIVVEPQGKVNKQTGKDAAEERTLSVKAYGFARFPKGERTLSVCSLRSQPAPPKGELFGIFRQVEQNLPLSGEVDLRSKDGEGSARLRQAALPPQRRAFAESGAAPAVSRHDPSRENAKPERPQTLRLCSIKNILSAIYAQSNAERI